MCQGGSSDTDTKHDLHHAFSDTENKLLNKAVIFAQKVFS